MVYNTKNKRIIIEFFDKSDEWYTVEQVAEGVKEVAKSSVYRIVSELAEAKVLLKEYSGKDGCCVYKADKKECREHFHIECTLCGKLVHIEDKSTETILEKIAQNNDFSIDKGKTVLYGICEKCKGRKGE